MGYIAEEGDGAFAHRFGGDAWQVVDPDPSSGQPALLLTLDLTDPRLEQLACGLPELPLPSHVNSALVDGRQVYRIDPLERTVHLLETEIDHATVIPDLPQRPLPLPERRLELRPMTPVERLEDENAYWEAIESFLRGPGFIRILRPVLWMDGPTVARCRCGRAMVYVASIGWEYSGSDDEIVPGYSFILGELVLYFFFCKHCLHVHTVPQDT